MDEKPKNLAEVSNNSQSVSLVTVILVIAILGVLASIILRSLSASNAGAVGNTGDNRAQSVVGSAPVISRVALREEWQDDVLIVYGDIYFTDADGDASRVDLTLVESNAAEIYVDDGIITALPDEQRQGTVHTLTWTCEGGTHLVTLKVALIDQNDNRSPAEHMFTITCRN
jgi:hypothetical protein